MRACRRMVSLKAEDRFTTYALFSTLSPSRAGRHEMNLKRSSNNRPALYTIVPHGTTLYSENLNRATLGPRTAWSSMAGMAVNVKRELVFVPTGSGFGFSRFRPNGQRSSRRLPAGARRRNREVVWYFQEVHHDRWDRYFPRHQHWSLSGTCFHTHSWFYSQRLPKCATAREIATALGSLYSKP